MSNTTNPSRILEGIIGINKPTGPSSAQVLNTIQDHFTSSTLFAPWLDRERSRRETENTNQKKRRRGFHRDTKIKIGHGGTLDPLATGVLITGIGSGTKELNSFSNHCNKSYEAVVLFGAATDTYDCVGKIVGRAPYAHITESLVREKLDGFKGKMMQRPPIFSAIKQEGKPLYEYAREGKMPPREIETRDVEVLEMEMLEWMEPGSHEFRWPEEEATAQEKKFAEMLLGVGEKNAEGQKQAKEAEKVLQGAKNKVNEDSIVEAANQKLSTSTSTSDTVETTAESSTDLPANATPSDTDAAPQAPLMSGALSQAEGPITTTSSTTPPTLPPAARIRMTVTSGFYVRSLCHDLGAACSSLGLMSSLIRTRQGTFEVGRNVLEYEDLAKGEEVWGPKVREMLEAWADGAGERENAAKRLGDGSREGGNGRVKEERAQKRGGDSREGGRKPPEKRRRERNPSSDLSS